MSFSEDKESLGLSLTYFIRHSASLLSDQLKHYQQKGARGLALLAVFVAKSPKHTVLTNLTPVTPQHSTVLTTAKPILT